MEGVESGPDRPGHHAARPRRPVRSCATSACEDERLPVLILSAKGEPGVPGQGLCLRRRRLPGQALQPRRVPAAGRAAPDAGRLGRRGRSCPGEPLRGGAGVRLRRQRDRLREIHGPLPGWARSA
ncbi:MAG: hypothetical protein MZV70_75620 [Desulfobacterales bacterium]|nr:hypothetical protein [Desulfobacterales bacterium]